MGSPRTTHQVIHRALVDLAEFPEVFNARHPPPALPGADVGLGDSQGHSDLLLCHAGRLSVLPWSTVASCAQ
jgi:hypothetical protein